MRILILTLVLFVSACSLKVTEFYSHHQTMQNSDQVA
ncbi:MAG: hypothetical protein ACI9T9_001487, partial [Oleiphilaceae bacterium]